MANHENLLTTIEEMTVADLNEFVKALEEKFGVSAAAMVAVSGGGGGGEGGEEKSEFDVILANVGGQKIQVIKAIKEILGVGLKEAKDVADGAPKAVKEGVSKDEAEELKKKLEEAGGTVELK